MVFQLITLDNIKCISLFVSVLFSLYFTGFRVTFIIFMFLFRNILLCSYLLFCTLFNDLFFSATIMFLHILWASLYDILLPFDLPICILLLLFRIDCIIKPCFVVTDCTLLCMKLLMLLVVYYQFQSCPHHRQFLELNCK